MGELVAIALLTIALLPKALLEAFYFGDRPGAQKTMIIWCVSVGAVLMAFCLAFLVNNGS